MGTTPIKRTDLGAGEQRLVRGRDFSNQVLEDINGKRVRYEDCSFSASIVERGYFHGATFIGCKFTGTRFIDSIFRSATFENCDFSYADFHRCVIPLSQLLANLPAYPNVRWEFLHNLRANAQSTGDSSYDPKLVWREIDTEIEHWRAITRRQSGYYEKYRPRDRFWAFLRLWRLLAERYVWGHGESLVRLAISTLAGLIALSAFHALGRVMSLETASVGSILRDWLQSFSFVASLYIDLPSITSADVAASPITSALAVILRYLSIGLAVPILYKYIAKRW